MSPRPLVFISAVSRELKSARQLVANTLTFLGYEPVWQDIFGTESGDLREMLRQRIDQCKGVVQLVGSSYGAEPPAPDPEFGRTSYTQYEALYARKKGKKVWYLFIDESFPIDEHKPEPAEKRELQHAYRARLQSDTHLFHPLTTTEGLEAGVLKLRDDLTRLRRGVKQWAAGVAILLALLTLLVVWLVHGQRQTTAEVSEAKKTLAAMSADMNKLRQGIMDYSRTETQVREARGEKSSAALQEQVYAELGKQLNIDPKLLRAALPQLAEQLKRAPNAASYERANAAYVAKDYADAERLALLAADEARHGGPPATSKDAVECFKLAGLAAQKQVAYPRAMGHFREAEKLTDRQQDTKTWADVQHRIADVLLDQGQYGGAEKILRTVVETRTQLLGAEDPDTLKSRNRLAFSLRKQGRFPEAETGFRELIALEEKVLGPEHPDTLWSRNGLASILSDQGKFAEAEKEYRLILALREKVLGPNDIDTMKSRFNLATTLGNEGNYAEAEAQYRELIALQAKVLGPEHPETLWSRSGLAAALNFQHRYAEGNAEYREVIRVFEKVLGPEHPDTLSNRTFLAGGLTDQGDFAEAERQCRELIKLQEKVLGPEHPDTLYSIFCLASSLKGQGKLPEARELAQHATDAGRRVLGPDNPATKDYERLLQKLSSSKTQESPRP